MSRTNGRGMVGAWCWCGLLAVGVVWAMMAASVAQAAAPSRKELAGEIADLRAELAQLREDFDAFRQKMTLPKSATRLLGDLIVRMERLERQLATLNGRMEEQDHALAELSARFARFAADIQARVVQLESGTAGTVSTAPDGESEGTQMQPEMAASAVGSQAGTTGASDGTGGGGSAEAASTPVAGGESSAAHEPSVQLPEDPRQAYDAAFSLLRRGDFAGAERAFAAFLKGFPTHPLAANAQYWLGETFYVRKDYAHAAEAFLKGYQNYRDRPKAADSLLKLAMSLAALGNKQEACAALAELATRFPNASQAVKQRAAAQRRRLACP